MNDEALNSISRERLLAWVGGSFAALALLLAVVGAYGTFAYAVARRRREIGVRLALGATRGDIVRFVARDAVIMIGVGATLGLGAALAGTRALAGLLFELSPRDSQSVLLALSTTMLAAALATYVPARRAAAIDPAETLRE